MMKPAMARRFVWVVASFVFALAATPTLYAEPRAPVIVALGDSLTAGYGLPQDASFPAQLEAALKSRGRQVTVINAGVSGDTAAAGLKRLDWAVPDSADAVIIELGANDALQGLPPAETKAVLAKIIERLQEKGLPILLTGMEAPRNLGQDYVAEYGAMFPDLAAQYDVLLYPFFLDGVALDNGLMLGDGLHPNGKGISRIVEGILPWVEELLTQVQAKN